MSITPPVAAAEAAAEVVALPVAKVVALPAAEAVALWRRKRHCFATRHRADQTLARQIPGGADAQLERRCFLRSRPLTGGGGGGSRVAGDLKKRGNA